MDKIIRPTTGHILDIDPAEIADQFLTRAHNVNTRKGFPSRIGGRRVAYAPFTGTDDPYHLLNLSLNTFNWWMVFGKSHVYGVEGVNVNDISPGGLVPIDNPSDWNTTVLNTIPVANNGSNAPMYWSGFPGDNLVVLPGWPAGTVCKHIVAFRYHLFALNIDGPTGTFENMVMHSDAAEPGALPASWTAAAGNEAGDFALSDTPGRCICGLPLAQVLFVYKPASVYGIEYVGQQPSNIFTQRTVSRSFGVYGPHCVCDLGTRHLLVGAGDVVLNDGINFQSIADNRVKRSLTNSIDETFTANSFVVRDIEKRETWVCIPEAGNQFCTIAHVWDERRDTWVTRDLNAVRYATIGFVTDSTPDAAWDADPQVWDDDVSTWNSGSVGSIARVTSAEQDTLYVEDTDDAIIVQTNLQKLDMAFDDDSQRKFINRVWIRGTGTGFPDLQFRMGFRDSPDAVINWQQYLDIKPEGTPVEVSGRYISIDLRSNGANEFTLDRMIFRGRYNGAY